MRRISGRGQDSGHKYKNPAAAVAHSGRMQLFKYINIMHNIPLWPHNLQTTPVFEKLFKNYPLRKMSCSNYPRVQSPQSPTTPPRKTTSGRSQSPKVWEQLPSEMAELFKSIWKQLLSTSSCKRYQIHTCLDHCLHTHLSHYIFRGCRVGLLERKGPWGRSWE